jgi:ubiquinone/menaquinone biosynthesis C-methylase UbiE
VDVRREDMVTIVPGRDFNQAVTRFWSFAAPIYDLPLLQRWVYRPAQDEVIAQLQAHGSRSVADIACGTGILADRIERELKPDEVYGVDMSEGMLAQAQARSSRVHWRRAPAEKLPFDDGSLDAVVTTSAFHFFDQPAALREFHRVLAPGGLATVATISPSYPAPLNRLSADRRIPIHNPSPSEVRALFEAAGFTVAEQHRIHRPVWTRILSDVITVGAKP